MYKQLLKSGATALAGYAAKRILNGLVKSPEEKVKEAIEIFKNVVSINTEDVLDDADRCFEEHYPEAFENDDFDRCYVGSFEDILEASKYLLATSENSDFIGNYTDDEIARICRSLSSIALAYWDHLMSDDDRSVDAYHGENGVYHVFQEA